MYVCVDVLISSLSRWQSNIKQFELKVSPCRKLQTVVSYSLFLHQEKPVLCI